MPKRRSGPETQRAIRDAAARLFGTRGIDSVSMRDIADAVGITEPAIYRHAANKAELVRQAFEERYVALAAALDARQRAASGLRAKLAAMVEECARLFDADEPVFRFLLLAQHAALPRISSDLRTPVTVVREVVAAAIARREIGALDADLATAAFFGLLAQPAVFKIYGRLDGSMSHHARALADMIWAAVAVAAKRP